MVYVADSRGSDSANPMNMSLGKY